MTIDLEARVAASLQNAAERGALPEPDVRDVVRRVQSRVARRRAAGVLAVILALVVGSTVALLDRGGSSPRVRVSHTPTTSTGFARPVLDSCTPTGARQQLVIGSSFTFLSAPQLPAEVFADPVRGARGPLGAVVRNPSDARPGSDFVPNARIGGRDARLSVGENLAGRADWQLADGSTAVAHTRGLSAVQLRAFVEQIDAEGNALPKGLQSIGRSETAWRSMSYCEDHGVSATITQIRGSLASRYAELVAASAGARRFDVGNSSVAIVGLSTPLTEVGSGFHQASMSQWRRLLGVGAPLPTPTSVAEGVVVPSVIGLNRAEAERLLNVELGFGLQVSLVRGGPGAMGLVLAQVPSPGSRAPNGTTIEILVGG